MTPEQVSAITTVRPAVKHPRSRTRLIVLALCAGILFSGFLALGTWQLFRLQWKLSLIERVEQRVHAQPVAPPGPDRWAQVTADSDEYRHVRLTGTFLYPLTAQVQAVTDYGNGFWLMTPMRTADNTIVLVNRGFIPATESKQALDLHAMPDASGPVTVTGLLRISEPRGGFLRHNDAANDRWYSRDVQAIAVARNLTHIAPYFVDADADANARPAANTARKSTDYPIAGLTVIAFHNNHLVYAFTWYALALMVAGAVLWLVRDGRQSSRSAVTDSDGSDLESEDGEQS